VVSRPNKWRIQNRSRRREVLCTRTRHSTYSGFLACLLLIPRRFFFISVCFQHKWSIDFRFNSRLDINFNPAPMHSTSLSCLIRTRSITACFPTRTWWRSSCASSFRRHSLPGARLPPLLLLVLYNGVRRWDAPTKTGELIALSPDSALWPWQPQTRYYLLDIGAFPKDELARRSSLAALLFRLEQRHPPEELEQLMGEVIGWFRQHEDFERLRGLFAELVREALAGLGVKVSVSEDCWK